MKNSREFQIAFVGLKQGIHTFKYLINDKFFQDFAPIEFWNTNIDITLTFDKKPLIFLLHFDINGTITIPCDRCGDDYNLTLWDESDFVIKMVDDELVERNNTDDPEIMYIPRSESILSLKEFIYEAILLSIPMQRIHPNTENGKTTCNEDVLKKLTNNNEVSSNKIWSKLPKTIT